MGIVRSPRLKLAPLAPLAAAGVLVLTGCTQPIGGDGPGPNYYSEPHGYEPEPRAGEVLEIELTDASDSAMGMVEVQEFEEATEVRVEVEGLEPGFHLLALAESGVCEPDSSAAEGGETGDFLSAGAPVAGVEMPPVYAREDGSAYLTFHTDAFGFEELRADDGSAFVLSAEPGETTADPAAETPGDAADAGDRIACGVVDPR